MATAPDRLTAPESAPETLRRWVEQVARRTRPERVHWCDGSEREYRELLDRMLASGELLALDAKSFPGCYLHRSHPSDVARVEHLTFVCPEREADAGPNNHWMAPAEARR
jgi:phosphoenolpyruvate carboxykinase (GTP)